ncbi:MAG: hypothetical protein ACTHM9_00180 [Gemmatimonadales bacterium]
MPGLRSLLSSAIALAATGCAPRAAPSPTAPSRAASALAHAESTYAAARDARDRFDVTVASGATARGGRVADLAARFNQLRVRLRPALAEVDSAALDSLDARAVGTMRAALARDLDAVTARSSDTATVAPSCGGGHTPATLDSLRTWIYACYGWAQSHVVVGPDTLDRLSVLGLVTTTDDARRRRSLFLALDPVWRSINASNQPTSPYRRLIALEARARGKSLGTASAQIAASGIPADSLEPWLEAVLRAWRHASPDTLMEPWDWLHENGRVSRALSPRIPLERLAGLDADVFRSLGADVRALRVHFDLAPRAGKDPVAFSTFGARSPVIEPWVFATYRTGGLDNLNELLHETGHAIHLAAIRTRPAFRDWPDSDPFTEAVADVVALDVYEPAWQVRWLGDSVPLAEGLRGRYGGIVLDVAWALFERRMLRHPEADPNEVWATLTGEYLGIRPHPELSWWAMRGQLVDAPGYMMNYAAGALLIAAIRERIRERHGPFVTGDTTWYAWLAPRLYRYGLERATRTVVQDFLGGPVGPGPLLRDLARLRPASP